MKQISLQDLKSGLSSAIAEAESGNVIVITRHNRPVAQLTPVRPPSVHRGKNYGKGTLKSVLDRATKGRYLEMLLEDRGDR